MEKAITHAVRPWRSGFLKGGSGWGGHDVVSSANMVARPLLPREKGVDIRGERDDTAIVEFGVLSQHLE